MRPNGTIKDRRPDRIRWFLTGLIVLAIIAVVAVFVALKNRHDLNQQQAGRTQAVAVFCVVDEALIAAGRNIIESSAVHQGRTPEDSDTVVRDRDGHIVQLTDGRYSRKLVGLGGPTASQRLARSKAAAARYEDTIARKVVQVAGRNDLLVQDGTTTLDCKTIRAVSNAG